MLLDITLLPFVTLSFSPGFPYSPGTGNITLPDSGKQNSDVTRVRELVWNERYFPSEKRVSIRDTSKGCAARAALQGCASMPHRKSHSAAVQQGLQAPKCSAMCGRTYAGSRGTLARLRRKNATACMSSAEIREKPDDGGARVGGRSVCGRERVTIIIGLAKSKRALARTARASPGLSW